MLLHSLVWKAWRQSVKRDEQLRQVLLGGSICLGVLMRLDSYHLCPVGGTILLYIQDLLDFIDCWLVMYTLRIIRRDKVEVKDMDSSTKLAGRIIYCKRSPDRNRQHASNISPAHRSC